MQSTTVIAFVLLGVLPASAIAQDQMNLKFGVKAGFEFVDYSYSQSQSFKKFPGSTISIFTGISSASNESATIILGLELNYVKLLYYSNNQQFLFNVYTPNYNANILYNGIFDEEFRYEFIEICFPVEIYPTIFNKNMPIGFYIGPSIGLGGEYLERKEKSRTFVDSLKVYSNNFDDETNPYSYPPSGGFRTPFSMNLGVIFFYKFLIIDLRYKYTFNLDNSNNNLFLQLGLAY
jgi:hypothetical protein